MKLAIELTLTIICNWILHQYKYIALRSFATKSFPSRLGARGVMARVLDW